MKIHVVQKGDTLWNIAKKYGVNFEELKHMNTQLSNPDMIMPGMKIKVPTGNVPVKKEVQKNVGMVKESVKKEAPIVAPKEVKKKVEHPYADITPPPIPVVEEVAPIKEQKKVGPYIPKMPKPMQPVEIDINNYNLMQMSMPQIPQVPPAPTNILPGMMAPEKEEEPEVAGVQEEMPEAPQQIPYTPPQPQLAEYPCVPISPVLPGSGLGPFACPPPPTPPFPYQGAQMQPYGGYPVPGYQQAANPEMFDDAVDELPPEMPNLPHGMGGGQPVMPYPNAGLGGFGGYPQSSHPQGGSPEMFDEDQFPQGLPNDAGVFPQQGFPGPAQPFGVPQAGFGVPGYQYGAPQQGPGVLGQQFGAPQQGFGVPGQQFGTPQQGFGVPGQQFGAPQQGFGVQGQQFGAPQQGFGVPGQQFGAPQQGFGVPTQPYGTLYQGHGGVPAQPYGTPYQGYGGVPTQPYGTSHQGYGGAPAQQYGAQPGFPQASVGVNPYQQMPFNQPYNPMFAMPDFDEDDFDD